MNFVHDLFLHEWYLTLCELLKREINYDKSLLEFMFGSDTG